MIALALWTVLAAPPDDWAEWRGPARNGISAETGWVSAWPAGGPPVAWKASVGIGFSAFSVAEGRAFTIGHAGGKEVLHAFDAATGKPLWTHAWESELGNKLFEGGPCSTPTVHEGRVYVLGRWGVAFALEAASGKLLWISNVQQETGIRIPSWGFAGSPRIHGRLVLLNMGEGGVALDRETGKRVWASADGDAGYSTPLVVKRKGGGEAAIFSTGESYVAADPATGRELWRIPWVTRYGVNAADPIVDGDRILVASGYFKGAGLFDVGAAEPKAVWESKTLRSHMNGVVRIGAHVYGVDGDSGGRPALKCLEFATGKVLWAEESTGCGGVSASDGKLLILGEKGELIVAAADPAGFKPLSRFQALQGRCWTVPVLAQGRIHVRNAAGDAVCFDVRPGK
jgi:outer membrane protein assembly factor BamB